MISFPGCANTFGVVRCSLSDVFEPGSWECDVNLVERRFFAGLEEPPEKLRISMMLLHYCYTETPEFIKD